MASPACASRVYSSIACLAQILVSPAQRGGEIETIRCGLRSYQLSNVVLPGVALVTDRDRQEALPMDGPRNSPRSIDGEHYREMADGLRKLAHQCRFAGARRELLELAASYHRRADHLDGRTR